VRMRPQPGSFVSYPVGIIDDVPPAAPQRLRLSDQNCFGGVVYEWFRWRVGGHDPPAWQGYGWSRTNGGTSRAAAILLSQHAAVIRRASDDG
jgi:hypothetical protein